MLVVANSLTPNPHMQSCRLCGFDVPPSAHLCPHCARPALYPNVNSAKHANEAAALEDRYRRACDEAAARGASAALDAFITSVRTAKVVMCRSVNRVLELAATDRAVYPTFYKLLDAELQLEEGSRWDVLRRVVEEAIFPGYREEIRFGALTLTSEGLTNYGPCSLLLDESMVAHRASVFEANCILVLERLGVRMGDSDRLPVGLRAPWEHRAKLAAAKLASGVKDPPDLGRYARLLLRQGTDTSEDEFIEVHVWGPMTVHTVSKVVATRARMKKWERIGLRALREDLDRWGVEMEVR